MEKKKNGFTVLEMIMVVMLTVIVLGVVTSIFITGNRVFSDSNIKSTLQMEGQTIQEQISGIGMQAIGIESVNGSESTGEIQNIKINSYDKDGNEKVFEISKQPQKLLINGNEVATTVESIKIDPQIIKDYNINHNSIRSKSYVNFEFKLNKKRTYNNIPITYLINVQTVFRNRNN